MTGGSVHVLLSYIFCIIVAGRLEQLATPPSPYLCMCVCALASVTSLVTGQLMRAWAEPFGGQAMNGL